MPLPSGETGPNELIAVRTANELAPGRGMTLRAARTAKAKPSRPIASETPRWTSRRRRSVRARSRRREIEPAGQPSCWAASSCVCPSRYKERRELDTFRAIAAIRHRARD